MLSQPTELVPTQRSLLAIIDGSGRKARDRIEHRPWQQGASAEDDC
jgi:hypothetical protein